MSVEFPDLKEIERRPQRYWNADGLPELTMGILWLTWGATFGLPEVLPGGRWLFWYWLTAPVILVVCSFGAGWATRKLKEKMTFPVGGYVAWQQPSSVQRILPAILALAVSAGVVTLVMRADSEPVKQLIAPGCALLLAAAFLIAVVRWRLRHYLVLSGISLLIGWRILASGIGLEHGMILLFLSLGTAAVVTGVVRLRLFLQQRPLGLV